MIEKIDGFEIYENKQSPRIINIDIGDEILNKLIFPFNKFDITALEYKPFTRFTIAKSLDDLSNNKLSKLAKDGYLKALNDDQNFQAGLNVFKGGVTHKAVADVFGHDYLPTQKALIN